MKRFRKIRKAQECSDCGALQEKGDLVEALADTRVRCLACQDDTGPTIYDRKDRRGEDRRFAGRLSDAEEFLQGYE